MTKREPKVVLYMLRRRPRNLGMPAMIAELRQLGTYKEKPALDIDSQENWYVYGYNGVLRFDIKELNAVLTTLREYPRQIEHWVIIHKQAILSVK